MTVKLLRMEQKRGINYNSNQLYATRATPSWEGVLNLRAFAENQAHLEEAMDAVMRKLRLNKVSIIKKKR